MFIMVIGQSKITRYDVNLSYLDIKPDELVLFDCGYSEQTDPPVLLAQGGMIVTPEIRFRNPCHSAIVLTLDSNDYRYLFYPKNGTGFIGLSNSHVYDNDFLLNRYYGSGFNMISGGSVYPVEQAFAGNERVLQALENEEVKGIDSRRYAKAIKDGLLVRRNSRTDEFMMKLFKSPRDLPRFKTLDFLVK